MRMHLSARVAWHTNGWNGTVCENALGNTWCSGSYSYPGRTIREARRTHDWCAANPGKSCANNQAAIPPCCYSVNAFGRQETWARSDPPDFFRDGTSPKYWRLPPATICVWPYEVMYARDGGENPSYDERLQRVRKYFAQFTEGSSLVFYYANYSNPFSEDDARKYVLVGISRLKQLGRVPFYEDASEETRRKFGGAFVWQFPVTSSFPDEGFRIPYDRYMDREEILQQIVVYPANSRNFKYATRAFDDDEALVQVEQFLQAAQRLKELGDDSADWGRQIIWLQEVMGELWKSRGLYPGMAAVLTLLKLPAAIPWFIGETAAGREAEAAANLLALVQGKKPSGKSPPLVAADLAGAQRAWKLRDDGEQVLLASVFPRLALSEATMTAILDEDRESHGISATLEEIADNPYILSEQYVGDEPDDWISFSKIDNGALPRPGLGGETLYGVDDWRRLRALSVECLRQESRHTFLPGRVVLNHVNRRLASLAEWKRFTFKEKYYMVDEKQHASALELRKTRREGETSDTLYLYWKPVREAELTVEKVLRDLAARPPIKLKRPMRTESWREVLRNPESAICRKAPEAYDGAIATQAEVCARLFCSPIIVLCGEAGTGKTTVVEALLKAVEKVEGTGTSMALLAPTGKAADRMREKTGRPASTIHSFLARLGWLNDNLTLKQKGGKKASEIRQIVLDECSMVDLGLMAALMRAVDWSQVQRLILVGDPNQLPPIGKGQVFAETVRWARASHPDCIGALSVNMRQMENRLLGRGQAILDLASLYTQHDLWDPSQIQDERQRLAAESVRAAREALREQVLARVQEGGDVDQDLRVIYWNSPEELAHRLVGTIIADMEQDSGKRLDPERPFELWAKACTDEETGERRPDYHQVLSPYRGEETGIEKLNQLLQKAANGNRLEKTGTLDGITLFDKVLQYRNRGKSNPLSAWSFQERKLIKADIYNGDIGFVHPHNFDKEVWFKGRFWFRRFQVKFARKERLAVNYGTELGKGARDEKPENNLELAYAISVHKAQGSEFDRVYFIVPKKHTRLLSRELFYTGLTRAARHCTLLVEESIAPLLRMERREFSSLLGVNCSLFDFRPAPEAFATMFEWYEEGKIHATLADYMVRSKSEVIIANLLHERDLTFWYEKPLYAADGSCYLPDFTIAHAGTEYYWEHLGRLDNGTYAEQWKKKQAWYDEHFEGQLLITSESPSLSKDAEELLKEVFDR